MADDIRYVVKQTIMNSGKILYYPGAVVNSRDSYISKGLTDEQWQSLCNDKAVIVANESSVARAQMSDPYKAPANIDAGKEVNLAEGREITDPDQAKTHLNNPNEVLGYDPKQLNNWPNTKLLSTIARVIPGLTNPQLEKMGKDRNKMIETLSQYHRDSSANKIHKVGQSAEQDVVK